MRSQYNWVQVCHLVSQELWKARQRLTEEKLLAPNHAAQNHTPTNHQEIRGSWTWSEKMRDKWCTPPGMQVCVWNLKAAVMSMDTVLSSDQSQSEPPWPPAESTLSSVNESWLELKPGNNKCWKTHTSPCLLIIYIRTGSQSFHRPCSWVFSATCWHWRMFLLART